MNWTKLSKTILALAPMADMTDSPFCRVCREVNNTPRSDDHPSQEGKNFIIFREMVSAEAIVRGSEKTLKMCEFEEIERPIVLQIFGGKPEIIVEAAKIIVEKFQPDGIDINMGCPVPKIAKKNFAGAALMKDHDRAVEIVKTLKKANLGLPVSVKTRLGWAKDDEILEFASKLEKAGVDLISIHGRTKKQGYSGQANWERIGEVKKLLKIPVIANGDINSEEDIEKCLEITGADGVMIGRGALGNPWIFSSFPPPTRGRLGGGLAVGETPPPPAMQALRAGSPSPYKGGKIDVEEIKKVVFRHAQLHIEHYGEEYGLKTFRKHLLLYFKGIPGMKEIKQELVKVKSLEDLKIILKK